MEKYKVDQELCSHPEWREDMFSRTCMVCGYNNLIEDYQTEIIKENKMKYLVELTYELAAKNKPQLQIIDYLKSDIHRMMIDKEEAKPLADAMLKKIREIEALHPRCKPITVHYTENTHDRDFEDQKLYCPELFTIHFKGERK